MAQYQNIGIYQADFDRYSVICTLTHKEKSALFHDLISQLETALKRSVQNKGELCFNWQMMAQIRGATLSITFVPKPKLVSEKVDMNSPEPSASEIEKKCFGDSK
jgi:hypothetical protein